MENLNETNGTTEEVGTETEVVETITMTKEELNQLLQSTADKRVSQAVKTVEKKYQEAEKVKSMSAEDKKEYELSQKAQELAEREQALILAENRAKGANYLVEKGLDAKLVDFVLDSDDTEMQNRVAALDNIFKASIQQEIEKRLVTQVPRKNMNANATISDKQYKQIKSYAEMAKLKNENPELFKQLSGK